jgi:hypothetical protein
MHLQSDFYLVSFLKGAKIINQLRSVGVFLKHRRGRLLLLTSSVTSSLSYRLINILRNILGANLMTIYGYNGITRSQRIQINTSIFKTLNRKINAITLLSTKTNSLYISLLGIHIASVRGSILLGTAHVIVFTKLFRELSVRREIYSKITNSNIKAYTSIIVEYG